MADLVNETWADLVREHTNFVGFIKSTNFIYIVIFG